MPTQTCSRCGKEFETDDRRKKICPECRNKKIDLSGEVKCVMCGKVFMAKNARSAKYCPECRKKGHYQQKKAGVTETKSDNQKMVKLKCAHCGRIFEVTWERYRKGRKYCSRACYNEAWKKKKGEKYNPTPVEEKPVQVAKIPYEPHKNQKDFHDSYHIRFRVLCCGVRFGKDRASINEAIRLHAEMCSENRDDTLVPRVMGWIVAPTYKLANQSWRELKYFMPENWVVNKNEAERQLITVGDGLIEVKSADDPDSLVAVGLDWCILTEAAKVKNLEEVWSNIRARLSSPGRGLRGKGGLAIINSTPKGRNYFYRMYQWGQDPQYPEWKSWHYTTYDNPYIPQKEIEDMKRTMTERMYRQEVLAEFLSDGGEVFSNVDDICTGTIQEPEPGMKYFAGWDPARTGDYSGFAIRNERGEMVYIDRWTGIPWTQQLNKIEVLCKKYNNAHLAIDQTGLGDTLPEAAAQRGLDITGYFFSNLFKEEIVNHFSLLCEQKAVVLIDHEPLKEELKAYEYEMTRTGKIRYSHPVGGHDDLVTATLLCFKDYNSPELTIPYMGLLMGARRKKVGTAS